MPVSIPAYLALRFVSKENLRARIKLLQNSYKLQVTGLTMFSIANFDKAAIAKPFAAAIAL
tara:strand:- start:47 stop:229 length:183 start_codon:yes stop_codon:yes gene_type:complete